jgi:excisionase family DNA binding protein
MDLTNQVLTVRQLAEYLHCHTSTIYRLLRESGLPGFKLGKSYRFVLADIEDWVHGLEREPARHPSDPAIGGMRARPAARSSK